MYFSIVSAPGHVCISSQCIVLYCIEYQPRAFKWPKYGESTILAVKTS